MSRETLVYRPRDPRANANGMVSRAIAEPLLRNDAQSSLPRPMVVSDIQSYRPVAADVDGSRPIIGGRRQHREFLARNNYTEVGNDYVAPKREELSQSERVADIKRAMGE